MSQSEKPFSVSDRRHFTPDGRPREDETAAQRPSEDAAATGSVPEEPRASRAAAGASDEPSQPSRPAGPADFGEFLLSLGAQAGMLLSDAAQQASGEAGNALDGVRSIVSILEMLRDKTAGRRTPEEERILESLLFELRMAYVERSRQGKS